MLKKCPLLIALVAGITALVSGINTRVSADGPQRVALGDWPEARGPNHDGTSKETGLPEKIALNGENFLWRAPYGGRSAPGVFGHRVYVEKPSGLFEREEERGRGRGAGT